MKPIVHIPIWRTFLNWIISVVTGSILWPLLFSFFKGGPKDIDETGGIMLISAILSALTSLPAMLILLFANWQLNKQKMPRSKYVGLHMLVHAGVALLTFLVLFLSVGNLGSDAFPFLLLALTYTIVGMTTWLVTFSLYRKKQVQRAELREDILDEL